MFCAVLCHNIKLFFNVLYFFLNSAKSEVKKFVSPAPKEGIEELEHYRLQVKIMTDLINVSHAVSSTT